MSAFLSIAFRALAICPSQTARRTASQSLPLITRRAASHQAQGRANKAKQGPGKRLGAKKTGGEYVVTGNIIYKQRGTLWFPGDNCFMGRDHTIHAAQPGYVRYYRDPLRHPKRKFIGVAFEKDQVLPQPANAPRIRRLGMLAYEAPTRDALSDLEISIAAKASEAPIQGVLSDVEAPSHGVNEDTMVQRPSPSKRKRKIEPMKPKLRAGYQYRITNYEIGREAERVGTAKSVVPFRQGNRWLAWRRRSERKNKLAAQRALGRGGKKKPVKM